MNISPNTIINASDHNIYYKHDDADKGTGLVPKNSQLNIAHDGITAYGRPREVYKTHDNSITIITQDNNVYSAFLKKGIPFNAEPAGWFLNQAQGWKDNDWLEWRHNKNDYAWDQIFELSTQIK